MYGKILGVALAAAIVALTPVPATAAQDAPAGHIKTLSGEAVVHRNGQHLPARGGMAVFQDDVLETGQLSAAGVTFADGSQLSLGALSTVEIDSYLYDVGKGKLATTLALSKGSLMFVSGRISKLRPDRVSIRNPVATVGIRGTRLLMRYRPD